MFVLELLEFELPVIKDSSPCANFLATPISYDCLFWLFGFALCLLVEFCCELASFYGFLRCVSVLYVEQGKSQCIYYYSDELLC